MKYNPDKVDEITLALLYVSSFSDGQVWKSYEWDITNRLHEKGLITNPVGKAKSFYLTDEGMEKAKQLAAKYFTE